MPEVSWMRTAEGWQRGAYRVRPEQEPRTGATRWRVEVARVVGDGKASWVVTSVHRSRRQAMAVAEAADQTRRRSARVAGHLVVAAGAATVFAVVSSGVTSIAAFVVAVLTLFVALRSFAAAIGVLLGDAWGWPRDDGRPRRVGVLDHVAATIAERRAGRVAAMARDEPRTAVHVLPPQ